MIRPLSPLEAALARAGLQGRALATNTRHGVNLIGSRCEHGTIRAGIALPELDVILNVEDWRQVAYLEGWEPVNKEDKTDGS